MKRRKPPTKYCTGKDRTNRTRLIVKLIKQGESRRHIAEYLGCSITTVQTAVKEYKDSLGISGTEPKMLIDKAVGDWGGWTQEEYLRYFVPKIGIDATAKTLGVSLPTIKRRCNELGIKFKEHSRKNPEHK